MRWFWQVLKRRAGLMLGSAAVTMLIVPVTAFAGGFAGNAAVDHQTRAGTGGSTSLGDIALFIGIIAAGVLIASIASRLDIRHKPVGVGLKPRATA
jgi:hypothetical protein